MAAERARPVVLVIAGSDSGGGAGIQADLKAVTAMGAYAATAVTCLTAQNLDGVRSVQPAEPAQLADQIDAVCEGYRVEAVKTGMLYSAELIRVVLDALERHRLPRLVVDPVMVATSGARLLREDAVAAVRDELVPRAAVVTPNLAEAEVLTGRPVRNEAEMEVAARAIHGLGARWALVKGGHLEGDAADLLFDGERARWWSSPRVGSTTAEHGTGCALASAIAAGLARGHAVPDAVEQAKRMLTAALVNRADLGGGIEALDPFWERPESAAGAKGPSGAW